MSGSFGAILFAVATALAVLVSLHSWRARQIYAWFRFLAFECLALLVALNAAAWFDNPYSAPQVASWSLFVFATALALRGARLLRTVGSARHRFVEDTQNIVDIGVYRYIRHPLYAALMLFGWGVFLKGTDLRGGVLAAAATGILYLTARREELLNLERFGDAYSTYMERTHLIIPFLW